MLDDAEYLEQLEFSAQVLKLAGDLPEHKQQGAIAAQAQQLAALIRNKQPGERVARTAQQLAADIIKTYRVEVVPKRAPDLAAGAELFAANCASCHGAEGRGDGPAATGLDPSPSNFHDRARQAQRNVYSLYSTISLGVAGTAMQAFNQLSEAERWSLAFYVSNFFASDEEKALGRAAWEADARAFPFGTLAVISSAIPKEIQRQYGDTGVNALAFLRANPQALAAEAPVAFTARLLQESLASYKAGDVAASRQHAISAYLEGFEPIENNLDAIDRDLRLRVEREMMAYRGLLNNEANVAAVETQVAALDGLLQTAGERLQTTQLSPAALALSALVILLREGLEAILVLAAVIAFLVKTGRRDALPYVHAGWIAALSLGALTWLAASYLLKITGADREITEGVTALLAAAVLLYVGFWLHGKLYAQRWQQFIKAQVGGALSGRTLWALALVSFLAVYREVFETVLFYQALWAEAGDGGHAAIVGGFGAAVVLLSLISWLIFRYSVRLPLSLFFGWSSALMAVLAVVFAGKGVAALQEAGVLPIDPVNFPSAPLIGIYPNAQALTLQFCIVLLVLAGFAYTWFDARKSAISK